MLEDDASRQLVGQVANGSVRPASWQALRPEVGVLASVPVGADLMARLTDLMAEQLSPREWVEVTVAWRRLESHSQSGLLTAVAALDTAMPRDPRSPSRVRPASDQLAPALQLTRPQASALVGLARRLDDLPAAADALADGRMDLAQVRVLDALARRLPDRGAVSVVEALAVELAASVPAVSLAGRLEGRALLYDPEWHADRARRGARHRGVRLGRSSVAGLLTLRADLPAPAAVAVAQVLEALGRGPRAEGDDRTLANRCADALVALVTGTLPCTRPSTQPGRSTFGVQLPEGATDAVPPPSVLNRLAELHVVVAADALHGHGPHAADPAVVPGTPVGDVVIDLATVRDMAPDARWRRLLADPVSGTLLDYGTTTYPPPRSLRRHVEARDRHCVGAGCTSTRRSRQVDHTTNFGQVGPDGRVGTTSDSNLGCACQRCHNLKTHGGATLTQPEPGRFVWTYPTGLTYVVEPRPLLSTWRDGDDDAGERPPPAALVTTGAPRRRRRPAARRPDSPRRPTAPMRH